jgi:hypothetical protein
MTHSILSYTRINYIYILLSVLKKGKDLYMDLDDSNLVLIDPIDDNVLNTQPITSIRVWGVGRDNAR